jgi:hypothetical protein
MRATQDLLRWIWIQLCLQENFITIYESWGLSTVPLEVWSSDLLLVVIWCWRHTSDFSQRLLIWSYMSCCCVKWSARIASLMRICWGHIWVIVDSLWGLVVLSLLLDPLPVVYHRVLFYVYCCFSSDSLLRILYVCWWFTNVSQRWSKIPIFDLQKCYGEVNLDLHRIFDGAGANGLKLKPKKSQVILILRSRAQIPQNQSSILALIPLRLWPVLII